LRCALEVGERADVEEELVAVRVPCTKPGFQAGLRAGRGCPNEAIEVEGVRQEEGAVVVEVVEEPVGDRRLRADRAQRRMGVDHARGGVEAGVGDPVQADAAVVMPGSRAAARSMVSKVSLDSSMSCGRPSWRALCGRTSTNSPPDMKAPRTSWHTKM
jgi:hypothetical protein